MKIHDRRSSAGDDAKRERPQPKSESVREYFAPEKSMKFVTRAEFYSLIAIMETQRAQRVWWRRLLVWLSDSWHGVTVRRLDVAKAAIDTQEKTKAAAAAMREGA